MPYGVDLLPSAGRDFDRIPRRARESINNAFDILAEDPRPPGCESLAGLRGFYRLAIGSCRIAYEVDDDARVVRVWAIGDRRDVYDVLRRRLGR
jgi:mRNA interferase RelE/StbE